MPRFNFVGPSYASQSLSADAQETINWYVENVESGKGNAPMVLYPSPGEKVFVNLNPPAPPEMPMVFDHDGGTSGHTNIAFTSATSSLDGEAFFGVVTLSSAVPSTPDPGAPWTRITLAGANTQFVGLFVRYRPTAGFASFQANLAGITDWSVALKLFSATPGPISLITLVQGKQIGSGTFNGSPVNTVGSFDSPVTAGNTIFAILTFSNAGGTNFGTVSISDNHGNTYGVTNVQDANNGIIWWHAVNVAGGATTVTVVTNSGSISGCNLAILELAAT